MGFIVFGSGGGGTPPTPADYQEVLDEGNVSTTPAIHQESGFTTLLDETGLVATNGSNASAQIAPNLVALSADGSGQVALREIGVGAGSFDVFFRRLAGTVAYLSDLINVPDASETVKGIAEIATQAETQAGTDDARIVTPLKLTDFWNNNSIQQIIAPPTSPTSAGFQGQMASDATWVYLCIADNSWIRWARDLSF